MPLDAPQRNLRWIKPVVIAVVVLGFLAWMTSEMLKLGQTECSLCLTFKDQRRCSTARGPSETEALDEAHRNACALLAAGVTETVACQRTTREEVRCSLAP